MTTDGCRILLVGEDNPLSVEPEFALYCYPPGCAGYRLRRILGLPQHQYLALHRKNLCVGGWSTAQARRNAQELLSPHSPWDVLVLLGRKVTDAVQRAAMIDAAIEPFSTRVCCPGRTLVSLPHPSGRNLVWNQPWARDRARQILREVAPELPWGSADAEEAAA